MADRLLPIGELGPHAFSIDTEHMLGSLGALFGGTLLALILLPVLKSLYQSGKDKAEDWQFPPMLW